MERKHQHILGVARSLLFQANLPKSFWAHAIGHAVHIINRLPTPFLSQKCPFQIVYDCLPDISSLKVFGSLCFASTLQANRHKLDSRSRKCVYLGYKQGVKGHILFDLLNKEIFISRDVIFFEHIFPYQSTVSSEPISKPAHSISAQSLFDDSIPDHNHNHNQYHSFTSHTSNDSPYIPSTSSSTLKHSHQSFIFFI